MLAQKASRNTDAGRAKTSADMWPSLETIVYLNVGTAGVEQISVRWEKGRWLGVRDETGEIIVGTTA